jgi:hypothetical protein
LCILRKSPKIYNPQTTLLQTPAKTLNPSKSRAPKKQKTVAHKGQAINWGIACREEQAIVCDGKNWCQMTLK